MALTFQSSLIKLKRQLKQDEVSKRDIFLKIDVETEIDNYKEITQSFQVKHSKKKKKNSFINQ